MDVDTNWCLYCGKKTEGNVYCSKYCHNLDKNKKQKFSNELISKQKIQKVHSISPDYNAQYSLKFKNRIKSYNPSMTRRGYSSLNQYNPYWMISNSINNNLTPQVNNKRRKNSIISISTKLDNDDIDHNMLTKDENHARTDLVNQKINNNQNSTQSTINYSSFDNCLNNDSTATKMKNIFSLFYKNNSHNYNNKENNNVNSTNTNTVTNKSNTGGLKRNESVLNLTNIYNIRKSDNSLSSSSSSIYSSNFNRNNNSNSNGGIDDYNEVIVINSSSNNKHIKNKEINRTDSSAKESNSLNSPCSLNGSSLMDISINQLSSATEVSSLTINSETITSYINSIKMNKPLGKKSKLNEEKNHQKQSKNANGDKNENDCNDDDDDDDDNDDNNNNVKLRFKNLYLSGRISHKISAKNIECLNNYRKQFRKSNEYHVTNSSDEFPTTLYTFRQINTRFPKHSNKKMSMENHKIQMFKDNNSINKDSKKKMDRIHHKRNANKKDYLFTLECLNAITTDKDTIKSIMKSNELVENLKISNTNNTNATTTTTTNNNNNNNKVDPTIIENEKEDDEHDKSFIIDSYNYSREIYENGANQFIANNEVNYQYERNFINGKVKTCYTFGSDKNNYDNSYLVSNNMEISNLEKQKNNLQQQLIQQIQQQSLYYQENKIDYSYSCTTLSSYNMSDECYSIDSDNEYSVPDITRDYYETLNISSNPLSSITSLSFKKNNTKNNTLSSLANNNNNNNNNNLEKLESLCNNINSTLDQIKKIKEIESASTTPKFDLEDNKIVRSMEHYGVQLKRDDQVVPIFQNNHLMVSIPEEHNTSFKLYDSDATESITSSSLSSTLSTDSLKEKKYQNSLTNLIYYNKESTIQKPFHNLINYS